MRPLTPHPLVLAATLALATPLLSVTLPATAGPSASPAAHATAPHVAAHATARAVPKLVVRKAVQGLDHPWDVRPIGQGRLLFTQRDKATLSVARYGRVRTVKFPSSSVWVSGETGLMGLAVDPRFAKNRRIYTCQGGFTSGGGHDVRVIAWKLDKGITKATRIRQLIGGFPTSSGRHGGCRLLVATDGSLHVGTGDAAVGTNPRSLTSLGGKTLRLDRFTGKPWPKNRFIKNKHVKTRYVFTYGHRNVQGLAQRADGTVWSIEQGTDRDDEVNLLRNGGDYGYHPVPGYNESVPMTDPSLPGTQYAAKWSSGNPTLATSGGTFLTGRKWGALDGALAVGALKASRVLLLTFNAKGKLVTTRVPQALTRYGRIREISNALNGDLLVTTDNGDGNDLILRVKPAS